MSDYFDRVERQIVQRVEAGAPRSSRRPAACGYLATAAAVAVVIVVVGVFLLARGSNPAPTPRRRQRGHRHVHGVDDRPARPARTGDRPLGPDPARAPAHGRPRHPSRAGRERDRRHRADRERRPRTDPWSRRARTARDLRLGGRCDHAERQDRRIAARVAERRGARDQPGLRVGGARRSRRGRGVASPGSRAGREATRISRRPGDRSERRSRRERGPRERPVLRAGEPPPGAVKSGHTHPKESHATPTPAGPT